MATRRAVDRWHPLFDLLRTHLDWVDPASLVALTFALRRLNGDRILALLIGRKEP